ncbi:MAG: hypothetical protein QXX30_00470 [Candidatus Aenigmatarchaeota archaeon]
MRLEKKLILLDSKKFDQNKVKSMIYEAVEKILEQNKELLFLRKPKLFEISILFQMKKRVVDNSPISLLITDKSSLYFIKTFGTPSTKFEDLEVGLENFLELLFESMYGKYADSSEKRYLLNLTKPFLMKIKTKQRKFYSLITKSYQTTESQNILFYPLKEEDFAKEKEIYFPLISKVSLSKQIDNIVVSRSYVCVIFEIEENF